MKQAKKHCGVVVPLVTPVTADGELDFPAFDRLIESQIAAGVAGVLILGTTGEGPSVPRALRQPLIERAVATARKRILVYANVAENSLADALVSMDDYLHAGADAVAVLAPSYYSARPIELTAWFHALLESARGAVVIYNIPPTTHVSIPLDVIGGLVDHPRLVGLKDSENNPERHEELLKRFGGRSDFSIFIGVGALMASGLKSGADGIVPSVGNLIPEVCQQQFAAALREDWAAVDASAVRQTQVAAIYQRAGTLAQSLAALKGLLQHRGICEIHVFPPLLPLSAFELESLHADMVGADLIRI